jgi:hypothetical protein
MVADLVAAAEPSLLVALVTLVDRIPLPPPPPRARGRPTVYPDRLFLKALVIMVVRRLPRVGTLLAVLAEPTPEMRRRRALLTEGGRFPVRRTWERRLRAVPDTLPAQVGCLGRHLVAVLDPWAAAGRAAALDSTPLRARGGEWHRKHRLAGVVPHSSIDTEAGWTRSGWHGWVNGWKLHLVVTAAAVWIPLAAEVTPANVADNVLAPALLPELPPGNYQGNPGGHGRRRGAPPWVERETRASAVWSVIRRRWRGGWAGQPPAARSRSCWPAAPDSVGRGGGACGGRRAPG